ncbi:hypothetical protein [Fodinicola acaciae]|uniref:hypothetical protein n=1 Tax=Fodinicola acaciae TaxID=2681555 RepID=UPI0013D2E62B|nr:hypothetical protein [Fodinicola acaciae]
MSQQAGVPTAVQPSERTRSSQILVAGIVRTAGVLVVGGIGVAIWRALAAAGPTASVRGGSAQPGYSVVNGVPALQLVTERLGSSLGTLAIALLLGAVIGFGAAGLRTMLPSDAGRAGGAVGWLIGTLWTPPAPVALPIILLASSAGAGLAGAGRAVVVALALAGVVAVLVAVAAGEPWQRRSWLPGWLAGVGAAGRALAALTGALVIVEPLVSQPGIGQLLVRSLVGQDGAVVAAAVTTLLLFALVGQLLGAVAGTLAEWLDQPAPTAVAERSILRTVLSIAAPVTLAVPLLALVGSLFAGSGTSLDISQSAAGPSLGHLLGTDMLGRDVLARLVTGFRSAWLVTLGGVALAAAVGLVWGGVAVLLEQRLPRGGRTVAEALLVPGRLVTVAPLLLAGVTLVGADRWLAVLAFALLLAPRLAAAVVSAARPRLESPLSAIRSAGGLLLVAWGVALAVLTGLQFAGVGAEPPAPALGAVLSELTQRLVIAAPTGILTALATLALTAPFFLAGWSLLRQPRADALATLDT